MMNPIVATTIVMTSKMATPQCILFISLLYAGRNTALRSPNIVKKWHFFLTGTGGTGTGLRIGTNFHASESKPESPNLIQK